MIIIHRSVLKLDVHGFFFRECEAVLHLVFHGLVLIFVVVVEDPAAAAAAAAATAAAEVLVLAAMVEAVLRLWQVHERAAVREIQRPVGATEARVDTRRLGSGGEMVVGAVGGAQHAVEGVVVEARG